MKLKENSKAIIFIIIATILLTELLTNATPITKLINPINFLILIFVYSIPVLLLREIAIKLEVGIIGLFLIGFAYGLFNEAILAQTILRNTGVPVNTFDNFGYFSGINFPWLFIICAWHSLHSFIFPLMITNYLYKDTFNKSLISKKAFIILAIATIIFSIFFNIFFNHSKNFIYFLLFYILIIIFIFLSKLFTKKTYFLPYLQFKISSFFSGLGIGIFIIFLFFLPNAHSIVLYFVVYVIFLIFLYLKIKNNFYYPGIVVLGIGSYFVFSLFSLLDMINKKFYPGIITSFLFIVFFSYIIIKKEILCIKK